MRYFVFNLEKIPNYRVSGKSINVNPLKHVARTLFDFELFYVTEGKLYIAQKEEICLKKGEILLHNKNEWQGGTRFSPCTFYWLHFNGEAYICANEQEAKEVCKNKEKWIFFPEHFSLQNSNRLSILLTELNHHFFESNNTIVKDHFTAVILAEIAHQWSQKIEINTDKRFDEILGYLSLHITQDISFTELAEKFSYNPKYLSVLFRKYTGKTAKEYVRDKRISAAKEMLVSGNEPIKFIALAVGYEDEYYFMRIFKKCTGLSPKTYRKTFFACYYS